MNVNPSLPDTNQKPQVEVYQSLRVDRVSVIDVKRTKFIVDGFAQACDLFQFRLPQKIPFSAVTNNTVIRQLGFENLLTHFRIRFATGLRYSAFLFSHYIPLITDITQRNL